MCKRGQAWGFDLVVGLIIFLVGILSFYFYTINVSNGEDEIGGQLQQEGELIADSLMSEGSPIDWNENNVVRIGIVSEGRINEAKLEEFADLAELDYKKTKALFRTRNEYFVSFGGDISTGVGRNYTDAEYVMKVTRVVIYNQSIVTMEVYAWK